MSQNFPSLQASYAFEVTPSDTEDIVEDAANLYGAKYVYLQAQTAGGIIKVLPAGDHEETPVPVQVYFPQGIILPLAVRRVYAADTAVTTIIAVH